MIKIQLVGQASTTGTRWLQKYFGGEAILSEFVQHFHDNYRSSKGTIIPKKNVYARLRKDEIRGSIKKLRIDEE